MKFNSLLQVVVSGITLSSIFLAGIDSAAAVQITSSSGTTYDITSFLGDTFTTSVQGELKAQPWFGNQGLANELAGLLGPQLGYPNNFGPDCTGCQYQGPFFAYGVNSPEFNPFPDATFKSSVVFSDNPSNSNPTLGTSFAAGSWTWAQGTIVSNPGQPIPEPLSIIGTLIGGSAVWRMRKKLTASTKVKVKQ